MTWEPVAYVGGYVLAVLLLAFITLKDAADVKKEWWLNQWLGSLSEGWQFFIGLLYVVLGWFVAKPFRWALTAVVSWALPHLSVLSLLPWVLQVLGPPVIIFYLVVRFRGRIASLTYLGEFVFLVFVFLYIVYGAITNVVTEWEDAGKTVAPWFTSCTFSSIVIWAWVLPMTWLDEGNRLTFWETVLRLFSFRVYGPEGNPRNQDSSKLLGKIARASNDELDGLR